MTKPTNEERLETFSAALDALTEGVTKERCRLLLVKAEEVIEGQIDGIDSVDEWD